MTNNLEIGMTFKRYKDLCDFLSEQPLSGNSRKKQISEWERCFDYERDGQKFIITDVYDTPLPKIDGRWTTRNDQYINYIEDILLCYLYMNEETKTAKDLGGVELTSKKMYLLLGMINEQFYDRKEDLKYNGVPITKFNIQDFYKRARQKLNKILVSALNNMQMRCLIKYSNEYKICSRDENSKPIYHKASDYEIRDILDIEKDVLASYGMSSKVEVYLKNKSDEFYAKCGFEAMKRYGWDYYYEYYHIITGNYTIKNEVREKLSYTDANKAKLNNNIVIALNSQAEKRYLKSVHVKDDFINKETSNSKDSNANNFILPSDYVDVQAELVDYLIKLPANNK